jgi:hypothetical protein
VPPPGLLKFRIVNANNGDSQVGILFRKFLPNHACSARVELGSDDNDRMPLMLPDAWRKRLHLLDGGVDLISGLAEIKMSSQNRPKCTFEVGPRHCGN